MTCGGWKYAAASVIGTSHRQSGQAMCQDSHACTYIESSSALVTVLSDGAGSASRSQFGSRCACDYVIERLADVPADVLLSHDFAIEVLDGLRGRLQDLANDSQLHIRDLACTMLVSVILERRAAFWQIGDGAMCFRVRDGDTFQYAFWPEKGDFANVTFFVTDVDAQNHLRADFSVRDIVEVACFSDGIERLALDFAAYEPHTAFFNGLFPYLYALKPGYSLDLSSQIEHFLDSDRVNERTDDDKTLILAARLE